MDGMDGIELCNRTQGTAFPPGLVDHVVRGYPFDRSLELGRGARVERGKSNHRHLAHTKPIDR